VAARNFEARLTTITVMRTRRGHGATSATRSATWGTARCSA
jgi:hypothetical protein